jgi:hypothetical protein
MFSGRFDAITFGYGIPAENRQSRIDAELRTINKKKKQLFPASLHLESLSAWINWRFIRPRPEHCVKRRNRGTRLLLRCNEQLSHRRGGLSLIAATASRLLTLYSCNKLFHFLMIFEIGSGTLSSRSTTLQEEEKRFRTKKRGTKEEGKNVKKIIERHFELFA